METSSRHPTPASWAFVEHFRRASDTAVASPFAKVLQDLRSRFGPLASNDTGVNPYRLSRATVPSTYSPPKGVADKPSAANRSGLPVGRRSSLQAPKHPRLGLLPARCRSSSLSSDQAPPAGFCSATRPASTPASLDPPLPLGSRAARSPRRAPAPTSGLLSGAELESTQAPLQTRPPLEATTAHPSSPPASSRSWTAPSDFRTAKTSFSPKPEDLVVLPNRPVSSATRSAEAGCLPPLPSNATSEPVSTDPSFHDSSTEVPSSLRDDAPRPAPPYDFTFWS